MINGDDLGEVIDQPENSDLMSYADYEDYPSETRYVENWQAFVGDGYNAPGSSADRSLSDIFATLGNIFKLGSQTYSDISKLKYAQDYRTVPSNQTGIPQTELRKRQTGLNTGTSINELLGQPLIPGLPNIYLLGGGLLLVILVMRKK